MVSAMASAEVPKFTVVLRKAYAAGFYAMCAPGFEPRATLALPTASIGPMSPEASTNAVYANKIAEISDPVQRQQFIDDRVAEQAADFNLVELASRLIIDAIVAPEDLRAELLARLSDADDWDRAIDRRHHPVWPV
jgi:acetyl-CoA carboxylase carboxyltransferase component